MSIRKALPCLLCVYEIQVHTFHSITSHLSHQMLLKSEHWCEKYGYNIIYTHMGSKAFTMSNFHETYLHSVISDGTFPYRVLHKSQDKRRQ
jgi:hypothetical protein